MQQIQLMESLNLRTYFSYAVYIVRTNPLILLFLAIIGVLNDTTVFLPEGSLSNLINGFTLISTIFISPVIYGIYYEIIEDKYSSISNIFRTYVAGYLLLLFCMYIPIILTTAMITSSASMEGNSANIMLTILIFSLIFIYVVPTYFISGTIIESITTGVRFFFNNVFASAPLLAMALSSELLLLISHYKLGWLKEHNVLLFIFMDFSVYMAASIIDFLLFITVIYVLRNQDIKKRTAQ